MQLKAHKPQDTSLPKRCKRNERKPEINICTTEVLIIATVIAVMVDEKLPFFAVLRGHPYRLHNKLNTEFLLVKTVVFSSSLHKMCKLLF